MAVWLTALGVVLAYASCVLLFQSEARRAKHPAVVLAVARMRAARVVGFALSVASWGCFLGVRGAETGTAIWIAVLALAGIISLLVTAIWPKRHIQSVLGLLAASVTASLLLMWRGGGA